MKSEIQCHYNVVRKIQQKNIWIMRKYKRNK